MQRLLFGETQVKRKWGKLIFCISDMSILDSADSSRPKANLHDTRVFVGDGLERGQVGCRVRSANRVGSNVEPLKFRKKWNG